MAIRDMIMIIGSTKAAYQYLKMNNQWQYHRKITSSLSGIQEFNATSVSIYGTNYGLGDALFNSSFGCFVIGDCRY
jgi:hypothetical protein